MTFKNSIVVAATVALGVVFGCTKTEAPKAAPEQVAEAAPVAETTPVVEEFRKSQPVPGPTPVLAAPIPEKRVLENGLTVLVVKKEGLPLVSLEVVLKSGSAVDPAKLPGLAGFMGEMLKSGTKTRSSEAIADEIETLGSSLYVLVDEDSMTLGFTALSENMGPIFDVVADVLMNPAFKPREIERVRKRRLAALAQAKDSPQSAASRVFRRAIYGAHPYGHTVLGEQSSIEKIKRKDLMKLYRKNFSPKNAAAIVVGNISPDEAVAAVEKRLGKWKGAVKSPKAPGAPESLEPGVMLVNKKDAPQSQLRIGHLAVPRSHPDYFPLVMCNAILGGLFNSRINMNLREDKGYTYGARSAFDFRRGPGPFIVYTGVRTDVTDAAIKEVLKEIDLIRKTDVTEKELQNAKNRYSLSLPGYFQSVDGIAGMFANIFLFDLPLDYYQQLPEKVASVTIADVRRVANEHIHPKKLSIVVVGDKNKVEAGLGDLQRGPVSLRDEDGKVVQ